MVLRLVELDYPKPNPPSNPKDPNPAKLEGLDNDGFGYGVGYGVGCGDCDEEWAVVVVVVVVVVIVVVVEIVVVLVVVTVWGLPFRMSSSLTAPMMICCI